MEAPELTNKRSVGQRSAEAELAIKFLRTRPEGYLITYEEGSKACGFDWVESRNIVNTARNAVWEEGIFYLCVIGQGYKRVDGAEASAYGKGEIRRIYKKAKRVSRKLAIIDHEKLPLEKKREHLVTLAQMGVLAHASRPKSAECLLRGMGGAPIYLENALQALMDAKKKA